MTERRLPGLPAFLSLSLLAAGSMLFPVAAQAQPGNGLRQGQPVQGQPARGQRGPGMRGNRGGRGGGGFRERMADMFQPSISSKDLARMAQLIDLTDDQKQAVEESFRGYLESFNEAAGETQEKIAQLRAEVQDSGDRSRFRELVPVMAEFRAKKAELEKNFFEEVQLLLDENQLDRWTEYEKARRREESLPQGRLSGEALDLVATVTEMDLDQEQAAAVKDTLKKYEAELDEALASRDEALPELEQQMAEQLQNESVEGAMEVYGEIQKYRMAVKKINQDYAAKIEALLPEEKRAGFHKKVLQRTYPGVFDTTRAEQVFHVVLAMDSLDDEQRESVLSLQDTYLHDLAADRKKLVDVIEEEEKSATPAWLAQVSGMNKNGGRDEPSPRMKQMMEIRTLDRDVLRHLRDVLTEEQFARLQEVFRPQRAPGQRQQGGRFGRPGQDRGGAGGGFGG
ncbi:MAG TPA: hypothetical protein ENJ06_01465 [Phycisphaeraceae bacterium]|nr:hypothetical protein [Phycisphaeraceae bacterium]